MKSRKKLVKTAIVSLVVLLLIVGGALVIKKKKMALLKTPPPLKALLPVQVASPVEGRFPITGRYLGTIRAKVTADIAPRISGRVFEVRVREGAVVKKGELLAVIDDRQIRDRIEELRARLLAASSALNTQEAIFQRDSRLYKSKAISREQLDRSRAARDLARAQVESLRASLSTAKNDLTYVRLRAPFDGVITKRFQDPGDLAIAGKPVLQMEAPESGYYVEVKVPQAELPLMKKGARVTIWPDNLKGVSPLGPGPGEKGLSLEISRIHPAVTAGTLSAIEADCSSRPFSLPTGATVEAEVTRGSCFGLKVPSRAILENVDAAFCFTVDEKGVVHVHKVRPIYKGPDFVVIEKGDIPGASRVIVAQESALLRLHEGQKVRPITERGRM